MNILMFTNTFTPHCGGVARSVHQFASEFRQLGHRVLEHRQRTGLAGGVTDDRSDESRFNLLADLGGRKTYGKLIVTP